jgi:invasion protein IalB
MSRFALAPCAAFVVAALTLPAAAATPAPASSPAPFTAGGWRVECAANNQKTMDCQATQQIVNNATGQALMAVAVRMSADGKNPVMLLTLPLGMAVQKPVKVTIGSEKAMSYPIQACTQSGCLAGEDLTGAQVTALRTQTLLHIAYSELNGQIITVTLPLAGFAAAYDKITK